MLKFWPSIPAGENFHEFCVSVAIQESFSVKIYPKLISDTVTSWDVPCGHSHAYLSSADDGLCYSFQCADSVFSCRLHEEWSVPNLIITSDHSSTGISCFSSSLLLLSLSLFVVSGAYNSNLCPIFEKWMDKHTTLGNIAGVKCHINQVTIQRKWIIMVTH